MDRTKKTVSDMVGARIIEIDQVNPGMGHPRVVLDNGYEIWFVADICGEVDLDVYPSEARVGS